MSETRQTLKKQARKQVKKHYVLLTVLCAVLIFFGTEFNSIVSNAQTWYDILTGQVTELNVEGLYTSNTKVIDDLIQDNIKYGYEDAAERMQAMKDASDPNSILGRQRGVFAAMANNISSGQLYATIGNGLHNIVHSEDAVAAIMVLLSMAFYGFIWIFIRNVFSAILRRVVLETRLYSDYPLSHLLHFRLVKRWNRASLTLFLQTVFQTLWNFTVIGGIIKRYSYFLTPFIVAENPDIKPLEAINLSRRMMQGHKWECFLMELSFLGWRALGFVTFGAADALWTVPYEMATFGEYYAALRREAKERELEGAERLNDDALFTPVEGEKLRREYAGVARLEGVIDEDIVEQTPVKRFFANNFGIWFGSLDEKKIYSRQQGLRQQTRIARLEMDGTAYPERLNPLWTRESAAITGQVSYLAPGTFWSIVVVFFAFCVVGWVWEVALHLITQGQFINRGALHGPWLPIYGGGVALIAVLLYRFRRNPALEAALIVVLCGLVEYFTSYFMELSSGMRWWDYTGYFLNLNGRICGEGLAVFAIGGMVAIYFIVPILDNLVTRVKPKVLIPVCVVLLICFMADLVYSHYVPNTGKGITDYDQYRNVETVPEEIQEPAAAEAALQ